MWAQLCSVVLGVRRVVALANDALTGIAITFCAAIPSRVCQRTGGGWLGLLDR